MRYHVKKIAIIAVLALVAFLVISHIIQYCKEQTSMEWFEKQDTYIQSLSAYASNMDDVYVLYLSNVISDADFLIHLRQLQGELNVLRADYEHQLEEHPVRIGTATFATKKGNEAIADLYDVFQNIIDMTRTCYKEGDKLIYQYLAYRQNINEDLASYLSAEIMIQNEMDAGLDES